MSKVICLTILFAFLFAPLFVFAQAPSSGTGIHQGFEELKDFGEDLGYAKEKSIIEIVTEIIKIVLRLLGLVGVILVIYGGFMWMTSAGNEEKLKKAKTILRVAIIGLAIVLLAYAIVYWIFEKLMYIT